MAELFEFPEGATPIADCIGLIPKWVHSLEDLNRVEAENIVYAQRKYLKRRASDPRKWFHVEGLKKIHREMFGNVWEWAGKYRVSTTSIGIKPALIPSLLAEFCDEVLFWSQHPVPLTFVERSARIHHRLVFIHPFENGNGRFSRLIADRYLLAWKCPYPTWPSYLNQEGRERTQYIQALKSADNGDYDPLIGFMKKLGARDPSIDELIRDNFYRALMRGKQGILLVKAIMRIEKGWIKDPNLLTFAKKVGLGEIAKLLQD